MESSLPLQAREGAAPPATGRAAVALHEATRWLRSCRRPRVEENRFTPDGADRAYLANGHFTGNALIAPRLYCGTVLHVEEDACQVMAGGQITSVRYASKFPAPRRERVSPGHLVAVAEVTAGPDVVVWRWYDAVVLGSDAGSVRLWSRLTAKSRPSLASQGGADPGTRAYLSAGLPGAEWWVAGQGAEAGRGRRCRAGRGRAPLYRA